MKKIKKLLDSLYLADTGYEWLDNLSDYVYDRITDVRVFFQKCERFIYWGWKMKDSVDFDSHDIYLLIHLKLSRNYKCFRDHGHCVWNSNENTKLMRKLRETKELALRLYEDDLHYRAYREADERFGHKTEFVPTDNPNFSRLKMYYENNPKRAELFKKARAKIYHKEQQHRKDRFYHLMSTYLERFWD